MAKPTGPSCNMRCTYCYYRDKESLFTDGQLRMGDELLKRYISQRFAASPGPVTHFEWHGGEPTLLGCGYFQRIALLQKSCNPDGRRVTNGLQTNGLLLDENWAVFLAKERFSVGLSLDGPSDLHDIYRKTVDGSPTHSRVVDAFRLLGRYGVFCNILCVVHAANAQEPDRVYEFFHGLGARYIQFLPLVTQGQGDSTSLFAADPETIGRFLCRIFDRWIAEDVGTIVIQNIDEVFRPIYGVPHALCIHRETCGNVAVLEHDGSFYACDHFVLPEYRIGNIQDFDLVDLVSNSRMRHFGRAKKDALPQCCRECDVQDMCNGGCPKDRIVTVPGDNQRLNFLCPAYKTFFAHSRPALTRIADHLKAGNPLKAFRL